MTGSLPDYFVVRGHTDEVEDIRFEGAGFCRPAPGVIEAIEASDALIIGPSNPILSIWPILAVPAIAQAVSPKKRVMAVSPLIGGSALKGPAHRILASLGYEQVRRQSSRLRRPSKGHIVDERRRDADGVTKPWIHVTDTRMPTWQPPPGSPR